MHVIQHSRGWVRQEDYEFKVSLNYEPHPVSKERSPLGGFSPSRFIVMASLTILFCSHFLFVFVLFFISSSFLQKIQFMAMPSCDKSRLTHCQMQQGHAMSRGGLLLPLSWALWRELVREACFCRPWDMGLGSSAVHSSTVTDWWSSFCGWSTRASSPIQMSELWSGQALFPPHGVGLLHYLMGLYLHEKLPNFPEDFSNADRHFQSFFDHSLGTCDRSGCCLPAMVFIDFLGDGQVWRSSGCQLFCWTL